MDKSLTIRQILYLFLFVFCIKLITALYLGHLARCSAPDRILGQIAYSSGDTFSYTGAMENYIQKKTYYFFNGKSNVLAGRLPHYSIPYFLLRQQCSQSLTYDVLVIFQIVTETIGIISFCLLALSLFGKIGFNMMLFLLLISTNWTDFTYQISPESLSISLLGLSLFMYEQYRTTRSLKKLFFCGIFFGWLVTLKAYYVLLLIPVGVDFIFFENRNLLLIISWKKIFTRAFLFVIPLILLLTPWIIRNYIIYQKFIPLQIDKYAGYDFTKADLACRTFITSWGGNFIFWDATSAGCYFQPTPAISCKFKMPEFVFSKDIQREEVEAVRQAYIKLQHTFDIDQDNKISVEFDTLTNRFKKDNPLHYYILSPVTLIVKFLKHSGSYYLPIHSSNPCYEIWQLIIKLIQSGIYWLSILVGLPGLILLSIKRKNILWSYLPIFLVALFPVYFGAVEGRYFRTIEPVLYLGIVHLVVKFRSNFFKSSALLE